MDQGMPLVLSCSINKTRLPDCSRLYHSICNDRRLCRNFGIFLTLEIVLEIASNMVIMISPMPIILHVVITQANSTTLAIIASSKEPSLIFLLVFSEVDTTDPIVRTRSL